MSLLSSGFGLTLSRPRVRRSFAHVRAGARRAEPRVRRLVRARRAVARARTCSDPLSIRRGEAASHRTARGLRRSRSSSAASTGDPFFGYTIVDFDDGGLLWLEPRPAQAGRSALVAQRRAEFTPADFDARTRVHEYGGGAVWTRRRRDLRLELRRRTRLPRRGRRRRGRSRPSRPSRTRCATRTAASPDGRVICVRESHGAGDRERARLVSGGRRRAATSSHTRPRLLRGAARRPRRPPRVPRVGPPAAAVPRLRALGRRRARSRAAPDESIFQPEWGPDGALHWVSDAGDGWWNLYRDGERLTALEAELGYPQWVFGLRTYDFLEDGRIACTLIERGTALVRGARPGDAASSNGSTFRSRRRCRT